MFERIKRLLSDMFGDTSVPPETTLVNLIELRDEIEIMIDAIREDLR